MVDNNPYIGPRTFLREEAHLFFGRDREARDLTDLVASERLVLFYAQSGAGKSSLINTRLIPDLENNFYEVLPVARLSGEIHSGFDPDNIYIYNLMYSLLQHEIEPSTLAELSLSHFLAGLDADEKGYYYTDAPLTSSISGDKSSTSWRRALIIDQFEEIFSTHPEAWKKREDFFRQLAQAMEQDSHLWIVLVMREDYIAALDPYVHLLPDSLRMRYYMQRLEREAALRAVKGPVEELRPFAAGVAEKLVEDLASIRVQRPDGVQDVQPGQYVEPVQLQVVCYSLWENLGHEGKQITEKDLQEVGDINQTLGKYYDERVITVATERNIPERLIREWFDKELITSGGNRNMVLRDPSNSSGLEDDVIQALQGGLIRAEMRAGQIWYELSHDRLIEPIRKSNAAWFEKNLSLFQRQAELWMQQGRSEGLLWRGTELENAEKQAETLSLTKNEQDFLEACRNLRNRERRDRIQRQVIVVALIISVMLLAAALYFGLNSSRASRTAREQASIASTAQVEAIAQRNDAELAKATAQASEAIAKQQADRALAGSLAAQADSIKLNDHRLALLLGLEAFEREDNLLTRTTLFQLLQFSPFTRLFGYNGPVTSVAISPNGNVIATASCKEYKNFTQCAQGEIILLDALTHQPFHEITGDFGNVNSLAFNPSGSILAAAGCVPVDGQNRGCIDNKGQITLWDVTNSTEPNQLSDTRKWHAGLVKSIAFSPDGKILASGSFDTRIILWDVSDPKIPIIIRAPLLGHRSFVNSLAFSPDGNTLVSGSDDKTILLWDVSEPGKASQKGAAIQIHTAPVNSIAFSPDGKRFASASSDNTVALWQWISGSLQNPVKLEGHNGYVTSVAFNADGSTLASAGFDNHVILWNASSGEQIGPPLSAHSGAINAVTFGITKTSDGKDFPYLISASDDRTIIQWDLSTRQPLSQPVKEMLPPEEVGQTATSGDLKAAVDGQQIKVQDGSGASKTLTGHTGFVNSVNFSPKKIDDRLVLASASNDQTVSLWDTSHVSTADEFLKLEGFESPVLSAFFRDNGKLITIEKGGHTIQWIIEPTDWKIRACEAVSRNLTESEWNQYLPGQVYRKTCENNP
jgi:WD40 repeat protein